MNTYNSNPRISVKALHRKDSPYRTITSTKNLLQKAKDLQILIGPRLFLNAHLDVEIHPNGKFDINTIFEKWNNFPKDPRIRYAILLAGAHSLLIFKRGATVLSYAEAIKPTYPSAMEFETIAPAEIGKLGPDTYPQGWDELDWEVYEYMKHLIFSYREVGEKLGVTWQTIKNRYRKISKDCKTWNSFFPKGLLNYYHAIFTFHTDYEIGFKKELRKLDRTTFLYKFDKTLILYAALDNYRPIMRFFELEKKGIIHNLRVSNPINWYKPDVLL
jgi:hypothetical protein